jgi:adenosylhomocysteinase
VEFLCKGQLSEKEIAATLQTTQAAEGHPSEVMDMSFANQFMSQLRLAELYKKGKRLENKVYDISAEQDQEIGTVKLGTMDIWIDKLTPEQVKYQSDYSAGT